MIDIDGNKALIGQEHNLLVSLLAHDELPKPTAYSYSGGGGIHLYYAIERLPALSMKDSVKKIKKIIISQIDIILRTDENIPFVKIGKRTYRYNVDTRVSDNQRCDRLPGSINPKTGKMVEFYTLGKKYTWEEFCDYFPKDTKKEKNNVPLKMDVNDKVALRINEGRRKGMLRLAYSGKKFEGCREVACFLMSNFCQYMNDIQKKQSLEELNNYFYEPLSEKELNGILRSTKTYRFSNKTIADFLYLNEKEYAIMFPSKNTNKKKKEMKERKIVVAKLWREGKKINEIATDLKLSPSNVKYTMKLIRSQEGFLYWSLGCDKKIFKKVVKQIVSLVQKEDDFSFGKKSLKSLISYFSIEFLSHPDEQWLLENQTLIARIERQCRCCGLFLHLHKILQ